MRIGISGSHRVGKSTLCKFIADNKDIGDNHQDIHFIPTNVNKVWQKYKLSPGECPSFNLISAVHQRILSQCEILWEGQNNFITDRTPLDFMAYLLSNIDFVTYVFHSNLKVFMDSCLNSIKENLDVIFILQPGIKYVRKDSMYDAENAMPYMKHIDLLIKGLVSEYKIGIPVVMIGKETLVLKERADELMGFIKTNIA